MTFYEKSNEFHNNDSAVHNSVTFGDEMHFKWSSPLSREGKHCNKSTKKPLFVILFRKIVTLIPRTNSFNRLLFLFFPLFCGIKLITH